MYLPISDIFGLLAKTPCSFFNAETPGWGILKSNFGVDPNKNNNIFNKKKIFFYSPPKPPSNHVR